MPASSRSSANVVTLARFASVGFSAFMALSLVGVRYRSTILLVRSPPSMCRLVMLMAPAESKKRPV